MSAPRESLAATNPEPATRWDAYAAGTGDLTFSARFESQVAVHSGTVAIDDRALSGDQVTYDQLNREANRIARAIIERTEDGPGRVVGLCGPDRTAIPVMLGAMKAGKVFVPIAADEPAARMAAVIEHVEAELVVVHGPDGWPDVSVPILDAAGIASDVPYGNLDPELVTDPRVMILYTSGSTGVPKGVVWGHVYGLTKTMEDTAFFGFSPSDRLSQMLPISFAMSTTHVFGALLNGGTLCPYDVTQLGLHRVTDWLTEQRVTAISLPPSLLRRILDPLPETATLPDLRYVMVGGERTIARDIELFQRHMVAPAVLLNQHAATEVGQIGRFLVTTTTEMREPVLPSGHDSPGRARLILDDGGNEVAPGDVGEIYVRSSLLTYGYWNNPELEAAAFRFDEEGPGGLYRTGDLGRIRPDGVLEHLGRKDARVKVNGVGVDLIEVEKALLTLPEVSEAVVMPHEPVPGTTALLAYVVSNDGTRPSVGTLRRGLEPIVPSAAIPSQIMTLDEMPLTSRGKINRKALPVPEIEDEGEAAAPEGDSLEASLVRIWAKVLSRKNIGLDDDFFDRGGTSLQALELFGEIHRRLGEDVPPTTLVQAPTVRTLAAAIRAGAGGATQRSLVRIDSRGDATPLVCVHGGGGGVFWVRDVAEHLAGNRPVLGIQAQGFEGTPPPPRPIAEMAAGYIEELREVQPTGPYLFIGLSFGGLAIIEMARQLAAAGEEVRFLGMLDTRYPAGYIPESIWGRYRLRTYDMDARDKINAFMLGVWKRLVKRPLEKIRGPQADDDAPNSPRLREAHFWSMHLRVSLLHVVEPIDAPITFFAAEGRLARQTAAWKETARAGFEILELPAGHHDIVREPVVRQLAAEIQRRIDAVDPLTSGSGSS